MYREGTKKKEESTVSNPKRPPGISRRLPLSPDLNVKNGCKFPRSSWSQYILMNAAAQGFIEKASCSKKTLLTAQMSFLMVFLRPSLSDCLHFACGLVGSEGGFRPLVAPPLVTAVHSTNSRFRRRATLKNDYAVKTRRRQELVEPNRVLFPSRAEPILQMVQMF